MHTLALKYVDKTFVLGGKELVLPCQGQVVDPFHLSVLSSGNWPPHGSAYAREWKWNPQGELIVAHRTIFLVAYDYPLSLKGMCSMDCEPWDPSILDSAIDRLCLVCSYAEYYGCLPMVASWALKALFAQRSIWENVASQPAKYFVLAQNLRSKDLYFDALRHMVPQSKSHRFEELAEHIGMAVNDVRALFEPELQKVDIRARQLEGALQKLTLSEKNSGFHVVRTTFLHMLKSRWDGRVVEARADERAALLARIMYGQWLNQQIYGSMVSADRQKERDTAVGTLAWAVQKLEDAATWETPSDFFCTSAAKQYSSVFGTKRVPEERIKFHLVYLLRCAVAAIHQTFPVREEPINDVTLTYRRTMYVRRQDCFTYIPLDENDLPWKDEIEWDELAGIPEVDVTPATEEVRDYLRGLGAAL